MAKKNFIRVDAWNVKLEAAGADKSTMTITGHNSSGTDIVVTVKLDEYDFPGMIMDMAAIGRRRLQAAHDSLKRIVSAVDDK